MIQYSRRHLRWGEAFFSEVSGKIMEKIDVLSILQSPNKIGYSHDFYTLHIDLKISEYELFRNIRKNTKYEINRARNKDSIISKTLDAKEYIDLFIIFYNKFAMTKGLRPMQEIEKIRLLVENDMFVIRAAFYNSEMIVCHTYITDENDSINRRARLTHSVSLFRESEDNNFCNLVGRANRMLHWEDMLYFKKNGYALLDLGGWYMDEKDKERVLINQFKKSFGGIVVKEYNCLIPKTLKGYLYIFYRRIREIIDIVHSR
jgi:lipid II:glycine glycyltransferase (peptidoglycan interpeptide bridge formation enzyme)